ncbi:MAG TPA: glutamine amidotransferase [Candidatus Dormibacteraeota bacterium]|jgi:CobQ-like glutamine amidotransferase family enzyme|nr:glutamine amidotransferase [Candidatus Dormibacteraeota bacterium]
MTTTRPLRIGHLYPEAMNIYGDIGNVRAMQRRAQWRGIDAEVVPIEAGRADIASCDILFMGGGQDRDQSRIFRDFTEYKREDVTRAVGEGAAILAVCGGYQLLGHVYVDADGNELEGLGLLDLRSSAGHDRWIGNVVVEADPSLGLRPTTLVGFENHGGRTYLGAGLRPLGRVRVGGGNNGDDGGEGVLAGRLIGTYLHGSLLPKNPALTDWLLSAGIAHRDGRAELAELPELDDDVEMAAHRRAVELAMAERGRAPVPRRR